MINIFKNIGKGKVNLLCYQEDKNNLDGSPMKIQEIEITDIGGIPYLKLDNLDPHMNIICGENGVGKTNILNSIAFCFTDIDNHIIKKRVGSNKGIVALNYTNEFYSDALRFISEVESYEPEKGIYRFPNNVLPSKLGINIKVNRVFSYEVLDSIRKDPQASNYNTSVTEGSSSKDLKQWLLSRDLYNKAGYLTEEERQYNIDLAMNLINIIDSRFSFKQSTTDNEIIITTPTGDIYFEYLSSGFKSIFFILLGIIKDIEFKHGKEYIKADEYRGVILIDEVELHLHPEWQGRVVSILKKAFKSAQFFITTHSPHVIQSAKRGEIIALGKTEDSEGVITNIFKRRLPGYEKYGFQGWAVEEILEDVMGMEATYGEDYLEKRRLFEEALDNNNREQAQSVFDEIIQMIHPNSPIKSVMEIQMVTLGR